ncbi:glycosyltransferase family 2 protein [Anabaena sp. UHCC 0399]|uniref:glycosyltransferase family 2 protein n=1 Tax=Anabaena sp. UHCC 0399 TaxID=3110238 RepID=UPI002B1FEAA7|nr:glycosyltransferase family 2 protein [Anabaena sp. UHCC 0399]MEA5566120.1 glycosyltransferase family 2 protein [Anabaena sp. UHCC 0399]
MESLISIIIPSYNAAPWIEETLKSALAQTWKNKEIIVVDDGSTDNSLQIAKKFISLGVKVISQNNRGASAARNRGFQESQGDFIQYLDADDLLAPDKIEKQLEILNSPNNLQYIASGEWARFYQNPQEALFLAQSIWQDMSPVDLLVEAWENHLMMHPAAWLVPRKIAEKAGLWNESLSLNDDGEYFCRVLLASQGVKFCQGAKSYYRSGNSNSLSGSKSSRAWESAFSTLELGTSNLLAKEDSRRTRHVCATVFQRFIYEVYPDVPELRKEAEAKVQQFGGSDIKPMGGPMFKLLSTFLGWKLAKKVQKQVYEYGYAKAALGWRIARFKDKARIMFNS